MPSSRSNYSPIKSLIICDCEGNCTFALDGTYIGVYNKRKLIFNWKSRGQT